jgi:GDPmannose 4,6-dehydratase
MIKKAFLTGTTGQDGSYLTEFLLEKGYEVHGVVRRTSTYNTERIDHLYKSDLFGKQFFTHYGDLLDSSNISHLIQQIQPDEVYHLGAQSHVGISFEIANFSVSTNVQGTLNVLEAVRNFSPDSRIYNASTSEMFGGEKQTVPEKGFNEDSLLNPKSPYGASKVAAHWLTSIYRQSYGLHASSGFLFNHTSPRRGKNFVCRKITLWFAAYLIKRSWIQLF